MQINLKKTQNNRKEEQIPGINIVSVTFYLVI